MNDLSPPSGKRPVSKTNPLHASVNALVNFGGRRPLLVVLTALVVLLSCWWYASHLEIRSDFRELLPRDSPGFVAFERRLERIGGRATIVLVAESPDRSANERFIDAMHASIDKMMKVHADCVASCKDDACESACGPALISSVESGTKGLKTFFEANKWLYANLNDLEEADATLDRQIAIRSGMVEDLLDEPTTKESSLGMEKFRERFKKKAEEHDDFPTGYFASPDGTQIALRVFSTTSGMGAANDEQLYRDLQQMADDLRPSSFHPKMEIGFGGDIPNAVAEKDSLVHEALIATAIAAAFILGGVVWFYGSFWALVLIGFPPLLGVGCAYAFATFKYGYVNASGAFLGAIILGNGVNYPIVLYSRYKEFRARGMPPDVARREAVWNAFRAELVGATVASIAYGSLTITRFRGFSQFGVIGFVGMVLVWITMIPCLPALIVLVERLQGILPKRLRERPGRVDEDGARGPVARIVGNLTERHAPIFVGVAAVITVLAAYRLPSFLKDPWEYDFDKLGSRGSRTSGPAQWSAKANTILSGRMNMNGSLVLANTPEQVPMVKERILENDASDPKGSIIDGVTTLADFLPGSPEEQEKKLEVLTRMRERLTPGVLARLSPSERKNIDELTPPETLHVLTGGDLPDLIKQRFSEKNGTLGTLFYIRYRPGLPRNDGHVLLRMSQDIDNVILPDGTHVDTASRATIFAEIIRSLERDGPLATGASFLAVTIVIVLATASVRGAFASILSLVIGVVWMLGSAVFFGERLNFLNFIALPITFGIGSEYPFNIYDRSRLLGGDVTRAVKLHLGAVTLCSYTTTIGYGSLIFSDNQALHSFGQLAMAGEVSCLIVAAFVLPSILHLIGAHTVGRNKEVATKARDGDAPDVKTSLGP